MTINATDNGDSRRRSNRRGDELRYPLDPKEWMMYSRHKCMAEQWWPNQPYYNKNTMEVVIECQRSGPGKHISLNAKLFNDALAAEQDRRVPQAFIRTVDQDGKYLGHETVQNVARNIGRRAPNRGRYGDYWWLNDQFMPTDPVNPSDEGGPL